MPYSQNLMRNYAYKACFTFLKTVFEVRVTSACPVTVLSRNRKHFAKDLAELNDVSKSFTVYRERARCQQDESENNDLFIKTSIIIGKRG